MNCKAKRKAEAQAERAERARALTFKDCAERYISVHGGKWTILKYAAAMAGDLRATRLPDHR